MLPCAQHVISMGIAPENGFSGLSGLKFPVAHTCELLQQPSKTPLATNDWLYPPSAPGSGWQHRLAPDWFNGTGHFAPLAVVWLNVMLWRLSQHTVEPEEFGRHLMLDPSAITQHTELPSALGHTSVGAHGAV